MARFDPPDGPWQYRILDALPPGIDLASLREEARLTPTQRLEALFHLQEFAAEVTKRNGKPAP